MIATFVSCTRLLASVVSYNVFAFLILENNISFDRRLTPYNFYHHAKLEMDTYRERAKLMMPLLVTFPK